MSRTLKLSIENKSSHTILNYSVAHSWNEHQHLLSGTNLPVGATSHSIEITSGYTQYDWYTVQLVFDQAGVRQTNFYCNSSSNHDQCILEIRDKDLDVKYFEKGRYDTGCNNKHYSGTDAEKNQLVLCKVENNKEA